MHVKTRQQSSLDLVFGTDDEEEDLLIFVVACR